MIDGSPARLLQALHGRPFAAAAVVAVVHDRHEHLDAAYSPDRRLVGSVAVLAHDHHHSMPPTARIVALLASSSINKGRNAPAAFA